MNGSSVRPYREGDITLLKPLLAAYPCGDLRRYRIINKEKQIAHLEYCIAACVREGAVWVWESGGTLRALAAFKPLPWDSSIFEIQMGQVPLFIHAGKEEGSRPAMEGLLDAMLRSCKERGVEHLNIRVDTDDLALAQVLETRRFYLVDTIVTYIFIPSRQKLGHFKHLFKTRIYREGDRDAVLQVASEAYRNFYGRYHADPLLPRERCNRLYQTWAGKILEPGFAERIIVAERKGRVVGFLGYRMNKEILESTGVKVVGGGLGGCLPEGFGAYAAILEEAMREGMHRYDMQDFETQVNNVNIIRIYQKLNFEYARSKYTFHARLT